MNVHPLMGIFLLGRMFESLIDLLGQFTDFRDAWLVAPGERKGVFDLLVFLFFHNRPLTYNGNY